MRKYFPGEDFVLMSRVEVRDFDRWAIDVLGIPGVVLMENAGRSCAELVKERLLGICGPRVCIFCGTGNNGGDGYVIARHLLKDGFEVSVVIVGERCKIAGDARINLEILEGMGQVVEELEVGEVGIGGKVERLAGGVDMVVDAIFGTGLGGHLRGGYRELIDGIHAVGRPVLAVDIPSGLDCDTGMVLGAAVRAMYTVTFVAVKRGFVAGEKAGEYTGEVFVASIGIEPENVKP